MSWRRRFRTALARTALVAALAGLVAGPVAAAPAVAAEDYSAVLQISKTVQDATLAPGDVLSYTIAVECLSDDCVDATVTDTLPPEFDALTLNPAVVVTPPPGGSSSYTWTGRSLSVSFSHAGGSGIAAGDGYSIQVTLSVPTGLSPDWAWNGVAITNTASAQASNAATVTSAAAATITIPYTVATTAGATWAPPTTQFKVGEASTLTLTTRNTSNAKAETLTLQAPTDPTFSSNLFETVDFASFGAVVFPAGADRIRVDAFVAGQWVDGALAATAALPSGVTAADVTGLRVVFGSSTAGAQLAANGAAGSVVLNLAQRSTTRSAATSLVSGAVVTANVRGTVSVPGHGTSLADATATYTIGGLTSAVSGSTVFSSARIPAGGWTISTVTGRNASNGYLSSLTVSQPAGAFLSDDITFGGFRSAGAAWPTGATEATVTWFTVGGTDPAPSELTAGAGFPATPALDPGQRITGFAIEFRGTIPVGATAAVPFRVDVAADAVDVVPGTGTFTQTGRIDGANDAGPATPATPAATLTVLAPQVDVVLTKSITPTAAVPAGGRSIAQLQAQTSSDSGYVAPTEIVITDVRGTDPLDYWQAFEAVAIAPTQVPVGATLLIEGTVDGTTWAPIDEVTATGTALLYRGSIPGGSSLVGLRFTFSNADGFAQGTRVRPNIAFVARATLRDTTDPTSAEGAPVTYANGAAVTATGDVLLDGGVRVSDSASASATAVIKTIPTGPGALLLGKQWRDVTGTVSSQSGQQRTADIRWGVEVSGFDEATVTDPADPTAPVASTVFQAFDLARLEAITPSTDPLIAYDQVTAVELYSDAADAWVPITSSVCVPASACLGGMPAYTLTGAQRADTLGVRVAFAEYADARTADPLAPPVGSGVASGPDARTLGLTFQIRNRVRDEAGPATPWVTADTVFNATDPGLVSNSVLLDLDGITRTESATIAILDPIPSVTLTKVQQPRSAAGTALSSPVAIPVLGDVAAGSYPTVQYAVTATNASAARAWYLRVTDQMPCTALADCRTADPTTNPYAGATWDPATSPFEYLTIRDLNYTLSANSGIDVAASSVVLWYANGTTASVSLTAADALTATQLQDVVGASALFAGASANGGTIASGATANLTFETRLRPYLRSQPTVPVGPVTLTNSAYTQVWDEVLDDTNAYASKSTALTLVAAKLAIVVGKSVASGSSATVLEATRTNNIVVNLTANQGSSTASTRQVIVEDTEAAFWNAFELRSLGTVPLPAGATRGRVDVQLNGSSTWTQGTAAASPALPSGITNAQITGIRFVFFKTDNSLFSVTSPAASWTTTIPLTVRLRSAYRDGSGSIPFPSTVTNVVTASTEHATLGTKTASASLPFALDPGTFRVDVEKYTPVKTTPAGETINFSLIVENTGTGYLDNPVVVDRLPVDAGLAAGGPLLFDPTSEVTYSTSAGGILPVTGVQLAHDPAARTITFSWAPGSRLAPGETYTIVVPLQVAPGLPASYGDVVNGMTFSSDRVLSACTNTSGNGEGVSAVGTKGCFTSNDVRTTSASAISSFKGVKGDVGTGTTSTTGAVNVTNAATACVADADGYYRNPCAAYSQIGATDLWKLQYTNGGNVPATGATVVDVLPRSGDTYLGTGASRGSTYKPVFAGGVTLTTDALSAGTTIAWQVTTTANPCPNFTSDSTCSTATWVDGPTFSTANYRSVTAIRIQYTFPGGELPPAATLAVGYRTTNLPTSTSGDGRAPVSVPFGTPRAWNSFGVFAQFPTGYVDRRVEPVRAGVQLASGPLQIAKTIDGAAAAYAPTSYNVTASCTVGGVAVTLPASGVLTLAAGNATAYTARLDGIPLGSSCDIAETTTGASAVTYAPANPAGTAARLAITTRAASTAPVPAAQIAGVTNTYGTTDLTITKAVSTSATVGSFGPFAFTLACTASGVTVPLAPGDASFSLADAASHTVSALPVTAVCQLRESDADDAASIGVRLGSGSTTTVAENAPATLTLGTNAAYTATVTNSYASGRLSITKDVTGADQYGDATFTVAVQCTYDGQTLFDDDVTLEDGDTELLAPHFPVGTACAVSETSAGGATAPAADRSVMIAAGTTNTVLTNRFDVGSLRIDKTVTGASALYGAGPFQAQVTCTWNRPGESDLLIPLPDSGFVDLTADNDYTATVTGLIAGADCSVTETKTGAATHHSISAPSPRQIPANGQSVVAIENHFALGSVRLDKVRVTASGAESFDDGPFEVVLACGIDRDGVWWPLDLGDAATQTLDADNGYSAEVTGILQGASCTATETDAGLAITSAVSTDSGHPVVVPASTSGPAVITVTNTFLTGELDVEKTVDEALVQGGDVLHYAIAVANVGDVDAGGVTVTDDLDADLAIDADSIAGADWTCAVTGRDTDGYGGTLSCALTSGPLGVGASAPGITYTAELRPEVAQDALLNTATVASTTIVVSGDDDTVSTPVKWLDVDATGVCVQDAPYLDYSVEARNLDVAGRTMHVTWLDALGVAVHTDDVPIAADGVVTGRLLFPGAAVDGDGDGVLWPGYRPALPGETPDWENLVLDPTLPSYGLRSGGSVTFAINPSATVAVTYPPATPSCAETPGDLESDLWMSKKASTANLAPGDTFRYTMQIGNDGRGAVTGVILVDDVPEVLRLISVTPAPAAHAGDPEWVDCVISEVLPNGYGGVITCELDRDLGYGQRAPDVLLDVQLSPTSKPGAIVNTAKVRAFELPTLGIPGGGGTELTTLALQDSAVVMATRLANTGSSPLLAAQLALALLMVGGILAALRRAMPRHRARRVRF